MCDKVVNDYPSAIQLVPDRYKTREMCEKAMNIYLLVFNQEQILINLRLKNCVIKLFLKTLLC